VNLTNSSTIPAGAIALAYDDATDAATFTFPGLSGGLLPDGSYRATIAAGDVSDPAGNALAGGDAVYNFIWSQGTSAADTTRVALDGGGNVVQVFLNSPAVPTFTATKSTLGTIVLNGAAGDDLFSVDLVNGNPVPPDHLRIDGNGASASGDVVLLSGKTTIAETA